MIGTECNNLFYDFDMVYVFPLPTLPGPEFTHICSPQSYMLMLLRK